MDSNSIKQAALKIPCGFQGGLGLHLVFDSQGLEGERGPGIADQICGVVCAGTDIQ